jgi:hypothetical protein
MADRYVVTNQYFIEDVTAGVSLAGRYTADQAFTCTGAGTFKVHVAGGCTGTVSGTNVAGTPITLTEGENTITTTGAVADGAIDITIGASTSVNWSNTAVWSDTSGGKCGYSVPSSATPMFADANSFPAGSTTLTVDATAHCLAMDWTGAANTPALAHSAVMNVYGAYTGIANMSHTGTSAMNFVSTGAVNFTAGVTFSCPVTFNGVAGQWTLQDALNIGTQTLTLAQGTLVTNNQAVTCGSFTISDASAKTLTAGASTVSCTALNYSGSNLTVTANTATVNISGTGVCALGTANWNGASFNRTGSAHTVSGSPTGIATFTRHPSAHVATDTMTITAGANIGCVDFVADGGARSTQLLIESGTLGTAATITASNSVTIANTDFMDITGAGAASWDLSAQTDIGDACGNSGITFPASSTQTWDGTTGSWSTAAKWTSRIPLCQDDVSAGGAGNTITVDIRRIGRSITFTGTPTIPKPAFEWSFYGSLELASGMTAPHFRVTAARGRGAYTINTNGISLAQFKLYAPGGTYTLQSDVTFRDNPLDLFNGTMDFNDNNVTAGYLRIYETGTKVLSLGNGTITLDITAAVDKWNVDDSTGLTLNAENSTIVLTNSTANAQGFIGKGLTYNNVTVSGAGGYTLTITGSNTFNNFEVDASSAAKTIVATGTTQIVSTFTRDFGANTVSITGGTWTKSGGGTVYLDYVTVINATGSPASTWYIGWHGTDGTGNTDFTFESNPVDKTISRVTVLNKKSTAAEVLNTYQNTRNLLGV